MSLSTTTLSSHIYPFPPTWKRRMKTLRILEIGAEADISVRRVEERVGMDSEI